MQDTFSPQISPHLRSDKAKSLKAFDCKELNSGLSFPPPSFAVMQLDHRKAG